MNLIGTRCEDLMRQQCDEKGWTILDLGVQPDHVQVFVRVWPSGSAAEVAKACTGGSAFTLRVHPPQSVSGVAETAVAVWTRSYFASTAGTVRREPLQRYIEAQSRP